MASTVHNWSSVDASCSHALTIAVPRGGFEIPLLYHGRRVAEWLAHSTAKQKVAG